MLDKVWNSIEAVREEIRSLISSFRDNGLRSELAELKEKVHALTETIKAIHETLKPSAKEEAPKE